MKKFSEASVLSTQEEAREQIYYEPTSDSEQEIPEYLFTHTEPLGYESSEIQTKLYWSSVVGTLSGVDNSILDVGCGRGDFGNYLITMVDRSISYTGIEMNRLYVDVANQKYAHHISDDSTDFNVIHGIFPNDFEDVKTKYNWIFHNTNCTLDYGVIGDDRNAYLKRLILKSIEYCTDGVVLMLLNTNDDADDDYVRYSYDDITEILFPLNLKFAIDNTDFKNIFKVMIFNEQF